MHLLTKTFQVQGLNQKILLERLILAGVDLLKVKKINQKVMEITIDSKDGLIFFAICKKTWYNRLIKVGGILSPFYLMVKKPLKSICLALSILLIIFSNHLYFGNLYQGDAMLYKSSIEQAFSSAGIKRYAIFNKRKLEVVTKQLKSQNNFGYLAIEKRGNFAVVNLQAIKSPPKKIVGQTSDLIAGENLKILKATVYSGTLLKQEGESVKAGEVIAGAYYYAGERRVGCELLAYVTAECTFKYAYQTKYGVTSGAILNAIVAAKTMLGEYEILSQSYKTDKKGVITVTLKYEKIICGG